MGIKQDQLTKLWTVTYARRHPITKVPAGARRVKIKTQAEAKRIYAELVVQVSDSLRKKTIPSWSEHLDIYFASLKNNGLTNSTIYNREKVTRKHTLPFWQDKLVDEIKTEDIHRILNDRFSESSESHRKFFIKGIRGAFQLALEQEIINRNPTPLLKFKISDKIKSVLNESQILTLLRRAQELDWHWYPHYAVGLFTGMRSGEMYALTWDKVSLEERKVLVNCSWSSKDGFKSTKSGDDRVVEIPNPLVPVLRELKLKSADNTFVLPRLDRWEKGEAARELRFFLKSIGLPEVRFHDLRASWATLLLGKGVAPSKVMSMGGWKDMDTMMIYMRKAGINIKDSTNVLDGMNTHGVEGGQLVEFKTR